MKRVASFFIAGIISPFILVSAGCTDRPDDGEVIESPRFHTEANEGKWRGESDSHLPIVTFTGKSHDEIEVSVPLVPVRNPRHYIEAIALLRGDREIALRRLAFSTEEPRVRFKLPDPAAADYSVVVKCNLHDMWRTEVPVDAGK